MRSYIKTSCTSSLLCHFFGVILVWAQLGLRAPRGCRDSCESGSIAPPLLRNPEVFHVQQFQGRLTNPTMFAVLPISRPKGVHPTIRVRHLPFYSEHRREFEQVSGAHRFSSRLEHRSSEDPRVALRLFLYIFGIWSFLRKRHLGLANASRKTRDAKTTTFYCQTITAQRPQGGISPSRWLRYFQLQAACRPR